MTFTPLSWLTSHTSLSLWNVQVRASQQRNIPCQGMEKEAFGEPPGQGCGSMESTVLSASGYPKVHTSVVLRGACWSVGADTSPSPAPFAASNRCLLHVKKSVHWAGEVTQWRKAPLPSLIG